MSAREIIEGFRPPTQPVSVETAPKGAYWMDRSGNLYPTKTPKFPSNEHNQWACQALGYEFDSRCDYREELQKLGWVRISAVWGSGQIMVDVLGELTPSQVRALRVYRDSLIEQSGAHYELLRVHLTSKSEIIETVTLKKSWSYRAPESKLHYDGVDFQRVAVFDDGRHVGEMELQMGRGEVVVRNAIIYRQTDTGRGIGQAAYQAAAKLFPGKTLRSSDGFSDQASKMWGALERKGLARKAGEHFKLRGARSVIEAEVKPPRRWLVTIPTSGTTPWRKVVVTATSEEVAWYQAYGQSSRYFRLSRSKYGATRVVVLKKRPSNGIVGYIDPILPEG